MVKVEDNGTGNLSDEALITILLTDVNEPPIIETQAIDVVFNALIIFHEHNHHYSVGFMHKHNTNEYPEFYFLAIEKNSPFICQYFKADDQLISYGLDVRSELIEKISQASISGIYEGYNDHSVTPIELPQWVKRQIESADEEVEGIEYV